MSQHSEESYVQHLRAEHRRVRRLLQQTLAALPPWEDADHGHWLPAMLRALKALRAEVATHFQVEEEGGCLEEAVARCPSLSPQVAQVQNEHRGLLTALDALIQRCERIDQPTAHEAHSLRDDLYAVVQRLREHEVMENRILQQAFGVSVEDEETHPLRPRDEAP